MLLWYEKQAARHIPHAANAVSSTANPEGKREWAVMNKNTCASISKPFGSPALAVLSLGALCAIHSSKCKC